MISSLFGVFSADQFLPLLSFLGGIVVYSLFVFHFYLFLSRRNILPLHLHRHKENFLGFLAFLAGIVLYLVEYILFFPLLIFFWFLVMVMILVFLSRSAPVEQVLLIAMSLVGAVRVTAYYSEDLSKDLAKMLPFALLGVFLVDVSFFSLQNSLASLLELPSHAVLAGGYLVVIVALESLLRILHGIVSLFTRRSEEES